ncbi:NF-X1-type zinc finger protein NFXL1-like [Cimex lectularius]|uniref:PHD-type domain-containing protein n=1 Tax=Cimex lectularius TaxID=79782 RepID=A0A8I6TFT4_CIMLE|nr:NF-X1-type zinc finger protein NFXL1-like [Cimex lectularius]
MSRPGGRGNPWNRSGGDRKKRVENGWTDGPSRSPAVPDAMSAQNKFQEAHLKMQKSVQKYMRQEYESSSEEEELESDNILASVLKNYNSFGGKSEDLGRTQNVLENSFRSGSAVCLICIALIKRTDSIWSCRSCYGFFHLNCIQRWSKDSITHQKVAEEEMPSNKSKSYCWFCPKCREEYDLSSIPTKYECFCGNRTDPVFQPWLVPHSCGEICNKPLLPECGHACLLLCHPGPCPKCPKMVRTKCHCGKSDSIPRRCYEKEWACEKACGKELACRKHKCESRCHPGACPPCNKTSLMKCQCGDKTERIACAELTWNCEKVCGKLLDCGEHTCEVICHKGECGPCPLSLPRSCPCGKEVTVLPCTKEVSTCGDTCSKLLLCGLHRCSQRCHKSSCGPCMEIIQKPCRCGSHFKEVQCEKEYLCEKKCKLKKDCGVHNCSRKCCDGQCPPCYAICKKTLNCGNHKCESVCHRGPCYPCQQTVLLTCSNCAHPLTTVPCGVKKRKFKCNQLCIAPKDCDHENKHNCHYGPCPPCKQVCNKLKPCGHRCPKICHSKVVVCSIPNFKPATPLDVAPLEVKSLECPECIAIVEVPCLGGHEKLRLPCFRAVAQSCGNPCSRLLPCKNHECSFLCHSVVNSPNEKDAGDNCEVCEEECVAERVCSHPCTIGCHPPPCPNCKVQLKLRCHCSLNFVYTKCYEWCRLPESKKDEKLSCGDQCPKLYPCGHRCASNCHKGECPNADRCRKKVKVNCKCKRIKKDVICHLKNETEINCDETCEALKKEKELKKLKELEEESLAERLRNQKELEMYEKRLHGGKKQRTRRRDFQDDSKPSFISQYKFSIFACFFLIVSSAVYYFLIK